MVAGGERHVDVKKLFDSNGPDVVNVLLSGITFTKANSANVFVQSDSSILLDDCIFEVRTRNPFPFFS